MENQIFELQYALDTFYFLLCGALVMWMAAGFAMLEAGLVRAKNTTEILTKNIALFAIACSMYLICGYELMYDGGFFLSGITSVHGMNEAAVNAVLMKSAEVGFSGDAVYSKASDFFFQVVFVATAMSIVSGAVAERMKLWTFLIFAVVMTGVIYPLEGAWTWNNDAVPFIGTLNYNDYAGSGIVHMAGAAAALAGVLLLGARKGKYTADGKARAIPGANLPLAALGTLILWLGWFGFNGGSALKLGGIAAANEVANVFVNTNAAAASGGIFALILARIVFGKADLTMLLNGVLAGLVAITAAPHTPTPTIAMLIGGVAGLLVFGSILTLDKLKIDDPVGAISVHGVAGLFGVLVVPITNTDASFLGQLSGATVIFTWVFVTSLCIWALLKFTIGIRVDEESEYEGVDLEECGMEAYPEFTHIN